MLSFYKQRLQFTCAVLEQPGQVSVLVDVLVEQCERVSALRHHCRDGAWHEGCVRPVATHQDFCAESDSVDVASTLAFEFRLKLLTQLDVSKHLRHLVDCIETTFHFEFLQHHFFSFTRDRSLVEQTQRKEFGVMFDSEVDPEIIFS